MPRTTPPEPGPIRPFELPAVTRTELGNGLPILTARHGELPIVTVAAAIDAGLLREGHPGLAALTASTLDTGAGSRSGDALAWELERLGADLDASAVWDTLFVQLTVPSIRLEPALALFADLIRRPTFPDNEVARLREEQLADLSQRAKDPRALANDMIARFLYGETSAYGRPIGGRADSVRRLQRDDVVAYHTARFNATNTTLIAVGDIDGERARLAFEPHFGDWTTGDRVDAAQPPGDNPATRTTHLVDRPDAVQSEIRVAQIAVDRKHPDYFAIRVMNTILGGAFVSRLNLNLREKHGFTYGVRSSFAFRRFAGPFTISTAVANDVTVRALEEILNEVDRLRSDGATDDEVGNAREYLAGILPLELETTAQIATRLADLAVYDLPTDYFRDYRASIGDVTTKQVARAARDHIDPDRFTIAIIGNANEIAEPLQGFVGTVHRHSAPE